MPSVRPPFPRVHGCVPAMRKRCPQERHGWGVHAGIECKTSIWRLTREEDAGYPVTINTGSGRASSDPLSGRPAIASSPQLTGAGVTRLRRMDHRDIA